MAKMTREEFVARVRQAVRQRPVSEPEPPARDERVVRLARDTDDLVARFVAAQELSGGTAHVLQSAEQLGETVRAIVAEHGLKTALAEADERVEPLAAAAAAAGVRVRRWGAGGDEVAAAFDVDAGLTGCAWALAETGSLVLTSSPATGRLISLAPLVHVALVRRDQIVPDLIDLFGPDALGGQALPAGTAIITGPSKTADIELKLVTGVHGPGFVHAIILP